MKIHIAQQNYTIGDFEGNTNKIIEAIDQANHEGADLIIFSAMCLSGTPSQDLLFSESHHRKVSASIRLISEHTDEIAVIIGGPERQSSGNMHRIFNAAWFIYQKEIRGIIRKRGISNSDLHCDSRYFIPGSGPHNISFKGTNIIVAIGDDIGLVESTSGEADVLVNIDSSFFDYTSLPLKKSALADFALRNKTSVIYCNTTGAQAHLVLDGGSMIVNHEGIICDVLPQFKEAVAEVILDKNKNIRVPVPNTDNPGLIISSAPEKFDPQLNTEQIHHAIVTAIREYFSKTGLKKAIIGNSGGIDSAVTIALACEALGSENVFSLLMPSQYSSDHSITDAKQLCKNLKSSYEIIPIEGVYHSFITALQPVFKDAPADVTEENIQARTRGNLLMAVANKFNYVLLNTSNKSELAVGYGTLYGDMAGGLSVLGDCYKLQVYALARYINRSKEIIPENIITKPPSAELRPGQLDTQSLPPYESLDAVLFQYIEKGKAGEEIKEMGYTPAVVDLVLRLVNKNEFKRHQFCPIIRVSPKAFGEGRKIPIVAKH